jgi:hypothetical protein
MNRPRLQSAEKLTAEAWRRHGGNASITMSRGQRDGRLAAVCEAADLLLELDDHERIVGACRKPVVVGGLG